MASKRRRAARRRQSSKRRRTTTSAAENTEENSDGGNGDEYEVEAILRANRRKKTYFVKWKGFDETSWITAEDANCPDLIREFEERQLENTRRNQPGQHSKDGEEKTERDYTTRRHIQRIQRTRHHQDSSAETCSQTEAEDQEEETKRDDTVNGSHERRTEEGTDDIELSDREESKSGDHDEETKEQEEIDTTTVDQSIEAPTDYHAPLSVVRPQRKSPTTRGSDQSIPATRMAGLERSLVGQLVAFAPAKEKWLKHSVYRQAGSTYIIGRVCDYSYSKRIGLYEIRWIDSLFQNQVERVEVAVINRGRLSYNKIMDTHSTPRWKSLCGPDRSQVLEVDDFDVLEEYEEFRPDGPSSCVCLDDVEKISSMKFDPDAKLAAPDGLYQHTDGSTKTRLKPEYTAKFQKSASSSFFAYLPLTFWQQVLVETNAQAIESNITRTPFSLDELMKFLGIMWYMALINKGEYANYWGSQPEDDVFECESRNLDSVMPLRRFKHLRHAFAFRRASQISSEDLKDDAVARLRPLLSMLKQTSCRYLDVGRDLAVDEASVAARSKFARHIIVYNPRKPTGKYHFKLYMCCCATTWIALNFRLHCESTMLSRASGVFDASETNNLAKELEHVAKTRQIVLEITRPFYNTGRIVNCDNYYTSVQLLEALRIKGLFCRGTVKRTSKHFPRHVVLPEPRRSEKNANKSKSKRLTRDRAQGRTSADPAASEVEGRAHEQAPNNEHDVGQEQDRTTRVSGQTQRGDFLQAVSSSSKILAASWCDGNIVTIISNADASIVSSVDRIVKSKTISVPAPVCIKEYNQNMQGVDRNDQVRSRFSVADGHSFKKWYKKLALAIIDIARVIAYLTRKLSQSDPVDKRDSHRRFIADLIKEMWNGDWQDADSDDAMLFDEVTSSSNPSRRLSSPGTPRQAFSPPVGLKLCKHVASSQVFSDKRRKRICIICRFEGRKDTLTTVVCLEHMVAVCDRVHEATNSFGCQQVDWTCWEKFHNYYLPRQLFSNKGHVRASSDDYKEKQAWLALQTEADLPSDTTHAQRTLSFESMESHALSTPTNGAPTPTPSIEY